VVVGLDRLNELRHNEKESRGSCSYRSCAKGVAIPCSMGIEPSQEEKDGRKVLLKTRRASLPCPSLARMEWLVLEQKHRHDSVKAKTGRRGEAYVRTKGVEEMEK